MNRNDLATCLSDECYSSKSWTLYAVISTKEKNITCGCLLRSKSSPLLSKMRDHNMKIFELQKKDKEFVFSLICTQVKWLIQPQLISFSRPK